MSKGRSGGDCQGRQELAWPWRQPVDLGLIIRRELGRRCPQERQDWGHFLKPVLAAGGSLAQEEGRGSIRQQCSVSPAEGVLPLEG